MSTKRSDCTRHWAALLVLFALSACGSGDATSPSAVDPVVPVAGTDTAKPTAPTAPTTPIEQATPEPAPTTPVPAPTQLVRKATYGHYFAANYTDTPADLAMLCGQAGVKGVVYRRTWRQVEPTAGNYDFSGFDAALEAIATSHNPTCQLWLFIEFKSFASSPQSNPCPVYLQARHSAPNSSGGNAATCFMWEPVVRDAYLAMMSAAGARYDANPRVEGLVLQESALGFSGEYTQDVADGGTYTATAWRDSLIELVQGCSESFKRSRCMAFLNFLRNGQQYLFDVSAAISAIPQNRACLSGPDLLPDSKSLYDTSAGIYEVLTRHKGCRANSAQNDSYNVSNCDLDCIFRFAIGGTFGDFQQETPRSSGVCINSYVFWNHRLGRSTTGLNWLDALAVIAAHPYGRNWYEQCTGGGEEP